jgi:hypothetical protein
MSSFSRDVYIKIFDQLLSEELHYSSSYASETNIQNAIKHVLGNAVKNHYIRLYSDLSIDSDLNVHFKIVDPDQDVIQIDLKYGS